MSPRRRNIRFPSHSILILLSGLALLSGCGRQTPLAPDPTNGYALGTEDEMAPAIQGAFFPLTVGNRWHATGEFSVAIVPPQGSPYGELFIHDDITRRLIGTEAVSERSYVVMEEATVESNLSPEETQPIVNWIRYRQDVTGLYEADIASSIPPVLEATQPGGVVSSAVQEASGPVTGDVAERLTRSVPAEQASAFASALERVRQKVELIRYARAALTPGGHGGGLLPGEITRLRYPLRPGASWTIRPDPLFSAFVEGVDALTLPAGNFASYRMRINSEFFGPRDEVHVWVGRSGQLAFRYHVESVATDIDGNEIGEAVIDYDEEVDAVVLIHD
jgi:hypothetical protein